MLIPAVTNWIKCLESGQTQLQLVALTPHRVKAYNAHAAFLMQNQVETSGNEKGVG